MHRSILSKPLRRGFTLVEIMVVCLILAILAGYAISKTYKAINQARIGRAVADICALQNALETFALDHHVHGPLYNNSWNSPTHSTYYPPDLAALVPKYDLCSTGPNGLWKDDITKWESSDDILYGADGAFIGPVEKWYDP